MSGVLVELHHLEVCTRLSRECCESLVSLGAVTELLTLLGSCNRSLPSLEASLLGVTVLLNLAKYEVTAPAVRADRRWPVLLLRTLVLARGSDATGALFSRCCCLLAALCRDCDSAKQRCARACHVSAVSRWCLWGRRRSCSRCWDPVTAACPAWRPRYWGSQCCSTWPSTR
ncbi:abnormal spindle-like microcephaly-associated protein homolog [Lampetra fluviatilis]